MRPRILSVIATIGLLAALMAVPRQLAQAQESVAARFATNSIKPAVLSVGGLQKRLPSLSGGVVASAQEGLRVHTVHTRAVTPVKIAPISLGCSTRTLGVGGQRVNQDCSFRRQAEESIDVNPTNPLNLIGGQNDSRIGWNHCGFDYSLNGGSNWGDGIPPFWQRLNNPPDGHTIAGGAGTNHTYDFASDPAVTFDADGRAFFTCIVLDIADNASGILMGVSPPGADGSFYNNVPDSGSAYVVDEENSAAASLDKEFIRADSYQNSPYRDNVYAVFTDFNFTCGDTQDQYCYSKIYFSRSTDHGVTWSQPVEIDGASNLCNYGNTFDPNEPANACNFDQGADPIVLPNGNVVVVFNNGNTATSTNQQLAVISTDGGQTFGSPVYVGSDVEGGEPYCSTGDVCVPGQYARTNDFPRVGVDRSNGKLYAVWEDYATGRYGIELSTSFNGGNDWTQSSPFPSDGMDDSQPAVAVSPANHDFAISYYATPRVTNENANPPCNDANGCDPSDSGVGAQSSTYRLVASRSTTGPFTVRVLTKPFPAPNGIQSGFIGDYSGIAVVSAIAHPIWSSTASAVPSDLIDPSGVANDEDIYSVAVPLP